MTIVEKLRRGMKMNRKEFSKRSGVAYHTIRKIEREGFRRFRKTTRAKLAKALEVDETIL